MKKLTVEAKDENLSQVLAFVDEELEAIDCPMKTQMQIDVAVEELFVNVSHYAYTPRSGDVAVELWSTDEPKEVFIRFTDSGMPYNLLEKPDPDVTLSADKRQIGGLGIFLVKKNMDVMEYESSEGKNIVTIRKKL